MSLHRRIDGHFMQGILLRRVSGRRDIGLGEVVAHEQQRVVLDLCRRVGQAVAVVQCRRVPEDAVVRYVADVTFWTKPRRRQITNSTQPVHVGAADTPGMASNTAVGRSAQ